MSADGSRTSSLIGHGVREEAGSELSTSESVTSPNRERSSANQFESDSAHLRLEINNGFEQRRPSQSSQHCPEQNPSESLASKGEAIFSVSSRQQELRLTGDIHGDILSPAVPPGLPPTTESRNIHIRDVGETPSSLQCHQLQKYRGYPKLYSKSFSFNSPPSQPYSLRLPSSSAVGKLIDYYFQEVNPLFPVLDQVLTSERITALLRTAVDQGMSQMIQVTSTSYSVSTLLCSILALAEQLSNVSETLEEANAGWEMFSQGEALCLYFDDDDEPLLDVINYHTLSGRFLLSQNSFHKAAKHASTAIRLAYDLQLNIQDSWPDCSFAEFSSRKRVWWALYVLDQQVSRGSGRPYLISEREVCVGKLHHADAKQTDGSRDATNDDQNNTSFFQALVDLSTIYRQVWDRFCCATASENIDRIGTAAFDQQLLRLKSRLPPGLLWQRDRSSTCQTWKSSRIDMLRQLVLSEVCSMADGVITLNYVSRD